ncbi:hypothetical protein [Streptomyces sp. H27-C3]|uniref:hypothetical protein n=1 Tax=Streptomyces sp. H27-C3 TaxID=3046305 RepID=UPI0024B8CB8C|nr:hypothetical protein [Streptomyces sp. H27-C3]MDJ0465151.1 hypothetical protein [Streptomyces sp. H27-C3]
MKKYAATATALTALLAINACSSDEGQPDQNAASTKESNCKEVLGSVGTDWLKTRVGNDQLVMHKTNNKEQARDLFNKQMRSWEPKDSADPYAPLRFADAQICVASKKGTASDGKFNLRYDASQYPFSEIPGNEGKAPAPGNSDVKFAARQERGSPTAYTVYFKCAIPGARSEQEEQLPVAAIMTDSLTGDRDAGVHFRHLLHSVQVMTRTLDCQNKPDVPTEPPSSVK